MIITFQMGLCMDRSDLGRGDSGMWYEMSQMLRLQTL